MKAQNIFCICRIFLFCAFIFFTSLLFSQGTWIQKANFSGIARGYAAGFNIGIKGYIGTGYVIVPPTYATSDFWEYDRTTNVWSQKANYPGGRTLYALGFSIGNKGYIGTGSDTIGPNGKQFWEYNPGNNTWIKKADFPGQGRNSAIGFSIGNKGYIEGGAWSLTVPPYTQYVLNDLWEYDPVTNSWIQKANLPGVKRQFAVGFSIVNKGYVGTGIDSSNKFCYDDFWEWDQITNTWSQKANFPGGKRWGAYGYSIGNYGYVGMGADSTGKKKINDLWRYFPFTNTWKQMASFPGGTRFAPIGFSIGCQGFFGTGQDTSGFVNNDWWEYIPDTITAAVSGANTICAGDSVSLYAFGGIHFSWSNGASTQFITVAPSVTTTYSVIVSDTCGFANTTVTVTVYPQPVAAFSYSADACTTGVVQFTNNSSNATSWSWNFGDGNTSAELNPSHTYAAPGTYTVSLHVSGASVCKDSTLQTAIEVPPFSQLFIPDAFSPNGDGWNDTYSIFGKCITKMNLIIYNRWGEKVFQTDDQSKVWDGTYKGTIQNADIYMYYFDGTLTTGENIVKRGNITLMR